MYINILWKRKERIFSFYDLFQFCSHFSHQLPTSDNNLTRGSPILETIGIYYIIITVQLLKIKTEIISSLAALYVDMELKQQTVDHLKFNPIVYDNNILCIALQSHEIIAICVTGVKIFKRHLIFFFFIITGAFRLYDVDNDGFITRDEMYNIVDAIYQMVVSILYYILWVNQKKLSRSPFLKLWVASVGFSEKIVSQCLTF